MSTPQKSAFGHASTSDEVLEGIDLNGKRVIVTGGSGGLGEETARAMAARGAKVTLAARDAEKTAAAKARIESTTPGAAIDSVALDLSSLTSVRSCAKELLERNEQIDLLINNAGVMACPFAHTQDGFEMQFGTNHLGHFVLTGMLAPALQNAKSARVVNLSSGGHRFSDVLWNDPNYESTDYEKWQSYGQSKTANILFSVELDRRLRSSGVRAFAVHPGGIQTDLSRHLVPDDFAMINSRSPGGKLELKSIPAGAATTCYAATAAALEGFGALYLEDCNVAEGNDDPKSAAGVRSYALDAAGAKRLWQISEDLVGERFEL